MIPWAYFKKMTSQEFSQKVKAKYPVYQAIPDAELVQKIITKYPTYKSQISDLQTERKKGDGIANNPLTRTTDFMTQDVLGGTKPGDEQGFFASLFQTTVGSKGLAGAFQAPGRVVASYLGASAAAGAAGKTRDSNAALSHTTDQLIQKAQSLPQDDPLRASLLKQAGDNLRILGHGGDAVAELTSAAEKNQYTPGQITGTALNAAATALGFGINPLALVSKMLLSTGIGAAYGAAGALNKNASAEDVAKGAVIGGVTGAAAQGAMSGISYLASKAVQELPNMLLTKKLGFTPTQIQQGANKKVVSYILNNKKVGSMSGLANEADQIIGTLDGKVDGILASGSYSKGAVVSNERIAAATAKRLQANGWTSTAEDILNAVKDFIGKGQGSVYLTRDAYDVAAANTLRKGIDVATKPTQFLANKNPEAVTMAMEFADTLRSAVQNIEPRTVPMFKEMSKNLALRNALEVAASKGFKIGGLMDVLSATLGAIGGTAAGNPVIGIPIGVAAERAATSFPVVSGASVGLNQLGKFAPYLSKLTPAMRLFLLNSSAGVISR